MGEKLSNKPRHAELGSTAERIPETNSGQALKPLKPVQGQDDDGLTKKLLHFLTLLTLKEAYLTCRNFLGLIFHPFKTIKVIRREADPVQTLLIFGLPFYFWIGGVGMVLMVRYLIGIHLFPMGILAKTLLFLTSFLAGMIFSYLFYWVLIYVRRKNV